jgi:hypothetical protein
LADLSPSDLSSGTAAPEDVKNTATYRGLKAVVILLGVLIVIAFALLVVGALTRFHAKSAPNAAALENTIVLPAGGQIVSSEVQSDRLILRVKAQKGESIYIIDTGTGHLVGRVQTKGQ